VSHPDIKSVGSVKNKTGLSSVALILITGASLLMTGAHRASDIGVKDSDSHAGLSSIRWCSADSL
jgi:hypothetical protein